ncbi:MAG: protein kinase [Polyangia bacterium]
MDLAGKQVGNYIAKHELGSGGMGVVYLCEHPLIRRRVAAKVLHEELAASDEIVRRLFAEARAANEISSEHVIEVLDFGRLVDGPRERVYLIMEFLEGEGLGHRLWQTGLTINDSLHIVAQCCEALEASHAAGIVHRDLKPENIFLVSRRGDPNFVKILDFGIAKVTGNPSLKTRTGVLLGTPAYMSPEQCRGSGDVDARADIYSLGIVLYELTTGDVPFNGNGYGQVLLSQMTEAPKPPTQINRDLPKSVEAVILRALAKDPAQRYQSMAEMGAAIAEVRQVLDATRAPPPRKGVNLRGSMVSTGPRLESDGHAEQPTSIDAGLAARIPAPQAQADAATQIMAVVEDPAATMPAATMPAATMIDTELPAEVRAYQALAGASTQLREAPPRVLASVSQPVLAVQPRSGVATVIRERPTTQKVSPTALIEDVPTRSTTARNIVLGAMLLAFVIIGLAVAFAGR